MAAALVWLISGHAARALDNQRQPRASAPMQLHPACEALRAREHAAQQPSADQMLELAECYAQGGWIASAWSQALAAAAVARAADLPALEATCRDRAKALEPELSYLTVTTWQGQQVLVTQDGTPLEEAVLGTALPVDPGRHLIVASAPGKRSWSRRVHVKGHGDHVAVAVPVLPDDVQLMSEVPARPRADLTPPREQDGGSVQRTLGLVAGAVGIAGIAAGTLFGLKAASDWSDVKSLCRPYPYCGDEGARLAREADQSALISTIGFVTGIAGLSGGAVLWFTAPTREVKTPASVGLGVGRVMVRGPL